MDLWSFMFFVAVAAFIVFLGLGISWEIRSIFEPFPSGVFLREQYHGLGLAMFITLTAATLMLVCHITGVITMWEVGYAFAKL